MVPCVADNNAQFLSLKVGESNTETLTGIPALEAGKSYTYELTVGKNKVVVTGITVKDWTTDKIINGVAELDTRPYLTFKAEGEQTFKMVNNGYFPSNIEYSVNEGEWKNVVADQGVTFGGSNGTLRLRGTNSNGTATSDANYSTISFTNSGVKVACTGDIRTLLDYRNYKTVDTQNAKFCNLFENCTALTFAPKLPAETLASNCYSEMFSGCKNLKTAPSLPATRLARYCYHSMFRGCTNLTSVTMLAPRDQITSKERCCDDWLNNAGTSATARTLKVKDEAAYNALVDKSYLPNNWKKDAASTTVLGENSNKIEQNRNIEGLYATMNGWRIDPFV